MNILHIQCHKLMEPDFIVLYLFTLLMASGRDLFRSHMQEADLAHSSDDKAEVEESMDLLNIFVSKKFLPPFFLKSQTNQYVQLAVLLQSGQTGGKSSPHLGQKGADDTNYCPRVHYLNPPHCEQAITIRNRIERNQTYLFCSLSPCGLNDENPKECKTI